MNETLIQQLEAEILPGVVATDYFYQNSSQITFTSGFGMIPMTTPFCVPMGTAFEVYATMSSSGMVNGYIHDLSLREVANDSQIIAQSSAPSLTMDPIIPRDRDMSILYKGIGTG